VFNGCPYVEVWLDNLTRKHLEAEKIAYLPYIMDKPRTFYEYGII